MEEFNNQVLTKKQRKLLRKKEIKQESLHLVRSKKIKKIVLISLLAIFISGGIIFSLLRLSSSEKKAKPKIVIKEMKYDAGTVSMADGVVKHTYEIKNTGKGDLKINKIWTSCMCTSAILKVGDKKSPKFGMHDDRAFWSQTITSGQIGLLEVTFDPAFHGPQGVGSIDRVIYLSTNDRQNREIEIKLLVNVIK